MSAFNRNSKKISNCYSQFRPVWNIGVCMPHKQYEQATILQYHLQSVNVLFYIMLFSPQIHILGEFKSVAWSFGRITCFRGTVPCRLWGHSANWTKMGGIYYSSRKRHPLYCSVTSVDNKLFTCTFSCNQNLRIILTHPGKLECTLKIMCCTEKSTTLLVVIWRGCKYFSWFTCNIANMKNSRWRSRKRQIQAHSMEEWPSLRVHHCKNTINPTQ